MTHDTTYNMESLTSDYGYTLTDQFNGLRAKSGRQWLEVYEAAIVPADWNGDRRIIAKANLTGKRGAKASAFIYDNLHVTVL